MIDESIEEEHEPIHSPSNKFPEKAMNPVKLSLSPIKQVEDVILVTPKKEIVVVQMENENELVEIAALKEIPLAEDEFLQEMKEVKELLNESHKIEELMSQRAINNLLWNDTNIKPIKHHHHDVNKIKMSDLMGMDPIDLTSPASASLPKNYLLKDCDARSIIRGGTCKDTLLFIDQPGHSLEDDLLENRALWVN